MTLTIIEYGGVRRQIECESFEFRCNQVSNWIKVKKADGNKEIIYDICVIKALEQEPSCEDMGEVSDGYHTFNQLYHQRAILFATIVNQNVDKSWKSFKHEDGKYCFDRNGEWFIVGIDTPEGSYTYHYEKKYWNYFKCKELETSKHWDGHTEEDVTRLLSLEQEPCNVCISRQAAIDALSYMCSEDENGITVSRANVNSMLKAMPPVTPQPKMGRWIDEGFYAEGHSEHAYRCSECDEHYIGYVEEFKHCPNCGAKMKKEKTDVQ